MYWDDWVALVANIVTIVGITVIAIQLSSYLRQGRAESKVWQALIALCSGNEAVRNRAFNDLLDLGQPAVDELRKLLESDLTHGDPRKQAWRALGHFARKHRDTATRVAAVWAFRDQKGQGALDAVFAILTKEGPEIAAHAALVLGEMPGAAGHVGTVLNKAPARWHGICAALVGAMSKDARDEDVLGKYGTSYPESDEVRAISRHVLEADERMWDPEEMGDVAAQYDDLSDDTKSLAMAIQQASAELMARTLELGCARFRFEGCIDRWIVVCRDWVRAQRERVDMLAAGAADESGAGED